VDTTAWPAGYHELTLPIGHLTSRQATTHVRGWSLDAYTGGCLRPPWGALIASDSAMRDGTVLVSDERSALFMNRTWEYAPKVL
jgi:hypothetical protein